MEVEHNQLELYVVSLRKEYPLIIQLQLSPGYFTVNVLFHGLTLMMISLVKSTKSRVLLTYEIMFQKFY
jgi:hypothetical protein